jgi:quercetin dioxygenase-like cupin family protein
MTKQATTLNTFALTASEGRTVPPLNILGRDLLVKLANADTDGAVAIFHQVVSPMSGPPFHRHSREDEWFYILDGEITLEIDGKRTTLHAGDSAFAPRGTAHTIQNFDDATAEVLALVTPGDLNQFFEELSLFSKRQPGSDPTEIERIAKKYGIEILGPPLSYRAADRPTHTFRSHNHRIVSLPGRNPFFGQPVKINPATYLGGGRDFGPLLPTPGSPHIVSRNLTPDKNRAARGRAHFRSVSRDPQDGRRSRSRASSLHNRSNDQLSPAPIRRQQAASDGLAGLPEPDRARHSRHLRVPQHGAVHRGTAGDERSA